MGNYKLINKILKQIKKESIFKDADIEVKDLGDVLIFRQPAPLNYKGDVLHLSLVYEDGELVFSNYVKRQ